MPLSEELYLTGSLVKNTFISLQEQVPVHTTGRIDTKRVRVLFEKYAWKIIIFFLFLTDKFSQYF